MDSGRDVYFRALAAVASSRTPVGAWKLSRLLAGMGIETSEATCGRLLRSMETNGHVIASGRSGRVITEQGERVLKQWQESEMRNRSHSAFLESLTVRHPRELIDVLVARKAIEAETAALAAENATEDEIANLWKIVREHEELLRSGSSGVEKDAQFHRSLAAAGKNRVLMAALDVIYHDPHIGRALEYIRTKVGSRMVRDHQAILIEVSNRDSEASKRAMIRHIENVIRDVDKYWAEIDDSSGGEQDGGKRPNP